jgi:hypothetical protein
MTPQPDPLRRAAEWLVSIHADDVSIPKGSALWEDLQSLKAALALPVQDEPGPAAVDFGRMTAALFSLAGHRVPPEDLEYALAAALRATPARLGAAPEARE